MLRYRLWKKSGKLENDRREPRTSRGKIRKQRRLRGWPKGREDDLKPNTEFYTDLFPCSYQVWQTLYRSQLKTRTATHTTNTYPQTFHDNQTLYNHTQPSITITQHTAITHPITICHTRNYTHYCSHTHTDSHHSFSVQQFQPLSRSVFPPGTLCKAATPDSLGLLRGSAPSAAPRCSPDNSSPSPMPRCWDAVASPAGNARMRIQRAVSGRTGEGDPQKDPSQGPVTPNHPFVTASQRTFLKTTTPPRRLRGPIQLPARKLSVFPVWGGGTVSPAPKAGLEGANLPCLATLRPG